jgi:ribosome-binding protein aMBF1 (putative translation factor)
MDIIDKLLASVTPEEWTKTSRKMHIASLVADSIEAKGLTQGEFAKKIGKKADDVPYMLSGNYNYTIEELTQIEFVLNAKLFFSQELDWWMPDNAKQSAYQQEPEPLSMAAEP